MRLIFRVNDDHDVFYTSVCIQQVFTILNKYSFFPQNTVS